MDKLIYDSGFGILPKNVMIDTELSLQAKGLFAYFVSYAGNSDNAFPSRSLIQHQLGIGKDTLTKYLKELKLRGYVEVTQNTEKGRFSNNVYKLVPYTKNTASVNTPSENTSTADVPTNINSINNNNINKNNSKYVSKKSNQTYDENLSLIAKMYQENVGQIYPIIRSWLIELSETIEVSLFERAIEICIDRSNVTPGYLKGILRKWTNEGITTLEQLKAKEIEYINKKGQVNKKQQQPIAPTPKVEDEEVDADMLEEIKRLEAMMY